MASERLNSERAKQAPGWRRRERLRGPWRSSAAVRARPVPARVAIVLLPPTRQRAHDAPIRVRCCSSTASPPPTLPSSVEHRASSVERRASSPAAPPLAHAARRTPAVLASRAACLPPPMSISISISRSRSLARQGPSCRGTPASISFISSGPSARNVRSLDRPTAAWKRILDDFFSRNIPPASARRFEMHRASLAAASRPFLPGSPRQACSPPPTFCLCLHQRLSCLGRPATSSAMEPALC